MLQTVWNQFQREFHFIRHLLNELSDVMARKEALPEYIRQMVLNEFRDWPRESQIWFFCGST